MLSVFFLSITEIFGTLLSVASVFELPLLNLKTRPLMFQTGPDNSHDLPFLLRTLFDVVLHALEFRVKKKNRLSHTAITPHVSKLLCSLRQLY